MKGRTKSHVHFAALVLTLLCGASIDVRAATITVTNTADSGPGSLRAVLASASNGDIIDATGVSGTITLTGGQLLITNSKYFGLGSIKQRAEMNTDNIAAYYFISSVSKAFV